MDKQGFLFKEYEDFEWEEHWHDMPEF